MNIWLCKNCIKTQERENRRDLYTPALSLFNYHTKVKDKCLYQFLINITLSISIRQISEVLKQRQFLEYSLEQKIYIIVNTISLKKNFN